MKFFNNINKLIAIFLLLIFCFSLIPFSPAKAQLTVAAPGVESQQAGQTIREQLEKNLTKIKNNLLDAVMLGVVKGVDYMLNKVSYDLAVSLASGNWGQSPLFHRKSVGNYFAGVASDALGTALDSFGQGIGFNLCALPDVKLDLALKMGLHLGYSDLEKPSCTWQQLRDNYSAEGIKSKYWGANGENFSKTFNASLDITDTDMGIGLAAKGKIDDYTLKAEEAAKAERTSDGGTKALSSLISKDVLTPAEVNRDTLRGSGPAAKAESEKQTTAVYMGAALTKGSIQVLKNAAATFINTFAGTMVDNFVNKGMFPFGLGKIKCVPSYLKIGGLAIDTCVESKYTAEGYYEDARASTFRQEAAMIFADLLIAKNKSDDNYDLLALFRTCNHDSSDTSENCILDEKFADYLREVDMNGRPLTIAEALQYEKIDDYQIIGLQTDESIASKGDRCYESAYCYDNIKVLRKARVWPLGMEILAATATGTPPKLSEVLAGFHNPSSKYYKMVNPNWILKMPKTRCKAIVYTGRTIDDDISIRQEECADLQSCVGYDNKGNCNAYGYCLEEKNIWRFNADYCDSQYDTCKSFTSSKGKNVTYLQKTLDNTWCSEQNAGCTFFTAYKNNVGQWQEKYSPTINITALPSTTPDGIGAFRNNYSYFFNNQVLTCKAENAGCSRVFSVITNASNTKEIGQELFIKKAPDYLRCYDKDSNPDNGIQWPRTLSELNQIKPVNPAECANYAGICLPEEEGCNQYTKLPLAVFEGSKEETIVGKFIRRANVSGGIVMNDECPSVCEGYNSYKEMKTKYSNGNDLVYIIPKVEATCDSEEEGCSAFVNLNVTAGGNVQTEYYSDLRLCMTPDQNRQKNFYTYEGREGGGYKLKSYTLLKNGEQPAQYFRDPAEKSGMAPCNSTTAATDISGDCRAFRDDQGMVYHAYFSKTVVVSDKCTPYRAVKSEFYDISGNKTNCLGGFDGLKNAASNDNVVFYDTATGFCIYNGLPQNIVVAGGAESKICSQDKVSCRKYQGNTGNNIRDIFPTYSFDSGIGLTNMVSNTKRGWWKTSESADNGTTISLSEETLSNFGKSLKVTVAANSGTATRGFRHYNTDIKNTGVYSLSFLAKGTKRWDITLGNGFTYNVGTVNLTDNWRRYEFVISNPAISGSVPSGEGAHIIFLDYNRAGGVIFLDNVSLKSIDDTVYLVKDKLSVPASCDLDQNDNLPGSALGCRAYKSPLSKDNIYLHNFSYLCRDGAIGCTRLVDTYNKGSNIASTTWQIFNLGLQKPEVGNKPTIQINGINYDCIVPDGEGGCYVNASGIGQSSLTGAAFTTSTVLVYKQTSPTSSPIYLTIRKNDNVNNFCNKDNVGCTLMGKGYKNVTNTYVFEDAYIINDPTRYESSGSNNRGILCTKEAEGCDVWRSGSGNYYFKDPENIGKKVCVYKEETVGNSKIGKWVLKDDETQVCATGLGISLPSFGNTTSYRGYVGECPSSQDGCSRFDDHNDVSVKKCSISGMKCEYNKDCSSQQGDTCVPAANSYYLIDNGKLSEKINEECPNGASVNYGCVLLDQVNNPNKKYNTEATYEASNAAKGAPVPPVETETRDANILVKVARDRECNLWMYCNNYQVEDEKARCYSFGLCSKSLPGMFSEGNCDEEVTLDSWTWRNSKITASNYRSRGVNWADPELSGYALHNSYQIPSLAVRWIQTKNVPAFNPGDPIKGSGDSDQFLPRLVHWENTLLKTDGSPECHKFDNTMKTSCGTSGAGRCLGGECIYPVVGNASLENFKASALSCRGYPEENSPFDPWGIIDMDNDGKTPLSRNGYEYLVKNKALEICTTEKVGDSCDCNYKKVEYNNQFVYFPLGTGDEPSSICIGGSLETEGKGCTDSEDCGGGLCANKKSVNEVRGWQGYCVEKNPKYKLYGEPEQNPCLTWWPVEVAPGAPDIWIIDPKAAYEGNESKDRFMCIANEPLKRNPLPTVEVLFAQAGQIPTDREKPVKIDRPSTTTIDQIIFCNLGGNEAGDSCLDLGGNNEVGVSLNVWKSEKKFNIELTEDQKANLPSIREEGDGEGTFECTEEYHNKYRSGDEFPCSCEDDEYPCDVSEIYCTQELVDSDGCEEEGKTYTVPDLIEKKVGDDATALAILDRKKYAAYGIKWAKGDSSYDWTGVLATAGGAALVGGSIAGLTVAVAGSLLTAIVSSGGVWGMAAAVLYIIFDTIIGWAEVKESHNYIAANFVANLSPNSAIMQCYNNTNNTKYGFAAKRLVAKVVGDGSTDAKTVYCPLNLNNDTVGTMQKQINPVTFPNNGIINKKDVAQIDVVLGGYYCKYKATGSGIVTHNGCNNTLVEKGTNREFFQNNIISFTNKEITGCNVLCDVPKAGYENPDCTELGDVCINETKYKSIPKDEEDNPLIYKVSKEEEGKNIWEMGVLSNYKKDDDPEIGKISTNGREGIFAGVSLPENKQNFESWAHNTEHTDGLGIRIIWNKDTDDLEGAQIQVNNSASGDAGLTFFFVIHFTDGSCKEFARVSENSVTSESFGESALDFKPVTWRLIKGKTNMGDFDQLIRGTAVYNLPKEQGDKCADGVNKCFSTSSLSLIRQYDKGIKKDKDFTGYFSDLSDLHLDTYFSYNPLEKWARKNSDEPIVRNALINYENTLATTQDAARGRNSEKELSYNKMLRNMFAEVLATTPKGAASGLTFRTAKDCANPTQASGCGISIKPPVIAAPLQLSPGSTDCEAYKAAGGKTDCKTFALNTLAVNKSNCSDELLSGDNCPISPSSDVTLEFYAWADPAQMPVRRIMYQKQAGEVLTLEARSIANRKPLCVQKGWCNYQPENYQYQIPCNEDNDCVFYDANNKSGDTMNLISASCVPFDPSDINDPDAFGNTKGSSGTGCKDTPYEFHFTYPDTIDAGFPRVQVLDNWGWCSGDCKNAANGALYETNYGCYKEVTAQRDDCRQDNDWAWINYNGSVTVQ